MRACQPMQKRDQHGWRFFTGLVMLMGGFGAAQAAPQIKLAQAGPPRILKVLPKVYTNAFGFEVRTVHPSKIQGRVAFSKVAWLCQGSVCTTNVKYPGFGVTACHALAMKIGPVRSFRLIKQPPTLVPVKGYPLSAEQIVLCNQGISAPKNIKMNTRLSVPIIRTTPTYNAGSIGNGTTMGQGANRAKKIGEASNRMKQIKELQRLRDLGSVTDQAMGGGAAAGRQDCSHSADRAKCLRDNLNAGKAPAGPSGGGMRECIMGANPQNCFNSGNGKRPGTLSAGPGDPRDQVKDPRGMAADGMPESITVGSYHSGRIRQQSGWQTRFHAGQVVRSRVLDGENGDEITETVTYSDDGTSTHAANVHHQDGSEDIYLVELDSLDDVEIETHTHSRAHGNSDPAGQTAPEGGSDGTVDNCNRDLVTGRCKNPQPDPKGMTSQPGPDGENTGGILGRNAPKTDISAAINCGDANNEACNRAGEGLSNRAKPLDMKDTGPAPGGTPH